MSDQLAVGRMAFIQFAAPDPTALETVFRRIGMTAVARHRHKVATLYRQGEINFVLDADPGSHAVAFAREHGPSITGLAIPVDDPAAVRKIALGRGARPYVGAGAPLIQTELVEGVGGSLLYLVERNRPDRWFADFEPIPGVDQRPAGFGATHVDHVTHCVPVPEMRYWVDFYRRIFGFSIVFEFEAKGKASGFHTQAVRDDGMNLCVTILEPTTPESQIQEFMDEYRGAGVQHVALSSGDLYRTVDRMRQAGTEFLSTPGAYYDALEQRLPGHRENMPELRRLDILLDGMTRDASDDGQDHLLLQIFTKKMIGPIFFEAIQRKANYGFGEGNAQALFDAIEREQLAPG